LTANSVTCGSADCDRRYKFHSTLPALGYGVCSTAGVSSLVRSTVPLPRRPAVPDEYELSSGVFWAPGCSAGVGVAGLAGRGWHHQHLRYGWVLHWILPINAFHPRGLCPSALGTHYYFDLYRKQNRNSSSGRLHSSGQVIRIRSI